MRSTSILFFLLIATIVPCLSQWVPLKSPYGVRPNNLFESGERIWCTTASGVYFSDNDGNFWNKSFTNDYAAGFMTSFHAHNNIIIAHLTNSLPNVYETVISFDNGGIWSSLPIPNVGIDMFPDIGFNGHTILFGSNNKTYRSENYGDTWTFMDSTELPFKFKNLTTSGEHFFAWHTDGSLWRSDVTGTQWDSLTFADTTREFPYVYEDEDILLVGISKGRIHYSYDDGMTWQISTGVTNFRGAAEAFYREGDTLYLLHNNRIYQSLDMAVSWQLKSPQTTMINDMLPMPGFTIFVEYEALNRSYDYGYTVSNHFEGINNHTIYDMVVEGEKGWYNSHSQLTSASFTIDEVIKDSLIRENIQVDELIIGNGYAFVDELTHDGPDYWKQLIRISPDGEQKLIHESDYTWISVDHVKYTDDKLFYFTSCDMSFSVDLGDTWQQSDVLGLSVVCDIQRHENALFAVSPDGILRRMDGETEWVDVNTGLSLEIDPIEAGWYQNRLYSTEGALFLQLVREEYDNTLELFVSHDLGTTWTAIFTDYPDLPVQQLNSLPTVKNIITIPGYHVIALRDHGVFISADMGLNWVPFNDGLPQSFGWQIYSLQKVGTQAVVSTRLHGLWKLSSEAISVLFSGGKSFYDANANGSISAGEQGVNNIKVIFNDDKLAFTDDNGNYAFYHREHSNIRVQDSNPYLQVVPDIHQSDDANKDFALQLTSDVHDVSVSMLADQVHRPGFPVRYYVIYNNLGKEATNIKLETVFSDGLTFLESSIAPSSVNGNNFHFDIGSLNALRSGKIILDFMVDATTPLGSSIINEASISMEETDIEEANNIFLFEAMTIGAFDPNDITVNRDLITTSEVNEGMILTYMIRFQNVGTYYAEDVIIRNVIRDELDVMSISGIETSHPAVISYENRELQFYFDGIMLADSARNESESHGFVKYDMLVRNDVEAGQIIENEADIYFDFNLPVRTNKALTEVEEIISTHNISDDPQLMISPNPVKNGGQLQIMKPVEAGSITVIDVHGKVMYEDASFTKNERINTTGLLPGMYLMILSADTGMYYGKIIVQ